MNREEKFEENWKAVKLNGFYGRPFERISRENLARLFFELGFSNGVMEWKIFLI